MEINEIFSEYAESKNIFRTGSDNAFEWYTDSPNYFRNLKCELHETERECVLSVFLRLLAHFAGRGLAGKEVELTKHGQDRSGRIITCMKDLMTS